MHKVCGDDGSENGKTFMNYCLAACDNISIKCDGACPCQEARGRFKVFVNARNRSSLVVKPKSKVRKSKSQSKDLG